VRKLALAGLAKIGEPGLALLRVEMESKDLARRKAAVYALGAGDAAVVPLLAEALRDRDLHEAAFEAIGWLGAKAAPVAPIVAKLADESGVPARNALGALGPEAAPFVLDLVPRLPPETSYAMLNRSRGKRLLRVLEAVLREDKSSARRRAAAWALGRFPDSSSVSTLVQALNDKDLLVVNQAIWALGRIGAKAKAAIPALREKERDAAHRVMARDALKRIER
jgi:HEAT repeat protein